MRTIGIAEDGLRAGENLIRAMVAEWERRAAQGKEVEASIGLGAGRGFARRQSMLGMVEDAEHLHIGDMKKSPRVTFKMLRIAEDGPGGAVDQTLGLNDHLRARGRYSHLNCHAEPGGLF